jgi:CheY-like chemotaxis protein
MASRTLLCVEPEAAAVNEIRSAFEPYGFSVENIPSGEQAIEWARKNEPAAILVCVEPRKVGYAICSKIKRSPELAKIPLVLTSSEETQQTFDQHKKLKARAEDYLLKPLRRDVLQARLGALIDLGPPQGSLGPGHDTGSEDILLSSDVVEEEISVSDADIVDGEAPKIADTTDSPIFPTFPSPVATAEASIEQETDAAFAALQMGNTGPLEAPPVPDGFAAPAPAESWDDERTRAGVVLPELADAPAAPALTPQATMEAALFPAMGSTGAAAVAPSAPDVLDVAFDSVPSFDDVQGAPSPDDVNVAVAFGDAAEPPPPPAPPAPPPVDNRRLRELEAKVQQLERDNDRLTRDLEEARARVQAQPLSKEKEVLSLREIINRKEKDILDLRDALDQKERQILDHKNTSRELERGRRDLDERMLTLEKSLMAAQEKATALAQDKEKATERERGLKARLDDALNEIQKAHEEVDSAKKRLTASEERGRAEVDKVRSELEARLTEVEEAHRAEATRLTDERASSEASLNKEHEAEVTRLKAVHAAELEATQRKAADDLRGLEERLQGELARTRKDHDKALAQLRDEQAAQLQAERQAHQTAVEGKERDHKNELLALRRRHEEEQKAAEDRRTREQQEAEARRVNELEAAEARRRTELQTRDEEHHNQMAELDRRHFNEKTEMAERHRQEQDQSNQRAARAEGELAARTEEVNEAMRRMAALGADIDTVRADLRDRDVKLGQARDRIAELEAKVAEYEDQILRAFNRLRSDDRLVDRAKRALAVALTLLDERGSAAQAPAVATGTQSQKPASGESTS